MRVYDGVACSASRATIPRSALSECGIRLHPWWLPRGAVGARRQVSGLVADRLDRPVVRSAGVRQRFINLEN